jgi:malate dehydrogenase (oxaloacetate-decarboxylating)(NADP+)
MGEMNKLPIIMPLSNPIKNAECTFIDAMEHTLGKVIFASGSPFPKMEYKGKMLNPGQGNNMYIFPGLGLGAILSNATRITEEMVFTASETLAQQVTQKETDDGMIYPNLDRIREVSLKIAVAVIKTAAKDGHGTIPECKNLDAYVLNPYYKSTDGSKATAKFE